MNRGLTPKEKKIFDFIRAKLEGEGVAPTYEEVRLAFGFASINSVQQYLKQLVEKGFLRHPGGNLKRAVTLAAGYRSAPPVRSISGNIIRVRFAGRVAAGSPIEAIEQLEELDVPGELTRGPDCFALKVVGDSMIEAHICDGDTVLVRKQKTAENGQIAVVVVNNEATVKKFYKRNGFVELVPCNETLESIKVKEADCEIQGIVTGVIRKI